MATTDIHVRVDVEIKEETEKILKEIGITMSDLVNMTFRRTVRERGVPFEMRLDRMPENMRIETKEQLIAYLDKTLEEDNGVRYTIDEVKAHFKEKEREYKRIKKEKAARLKELMAS